MFVRARMRVTVRGASLNVSQQSLLISAEAVVEALSRHTEEGGIAFWTTRVIHQLPQSMAGILVSHKHTHMSTGTHT